MSKSKYKNIDGIGYVPDQLYVVWWQSKNDIKYNGFLHTVDGEMEVFYTMEEAEKAAQKISIMQNVKILYWSFKDIINIENKPVFPSIER